MKFRQLFLRIDELCTAVSRLFVYIFDFKRELLVSDEQRLVVVLQFFNVYVGQFPNEMKQ